jgi:hypothetical protein
MCNGQNGYNRTRITWSKALPTSTIIVAKQNHSKNSRWVVHYSDVKKEQFLNFDPQMTTFDIKSAFMPTGGRYATNFDTRNQNVAGGATFYTSISS